MASQGAHLLQGLLFAGGASAAIMGFVAFQSKDGTQTMIRKNSEAEQQVRLQSFDSKSDRTHVYPLKRTKSDAGEDILVHKNDITIPARSAY